MGWIQKYDRGLSEWFFFFFASSNINLIIINTNILFSEMILKFLYGIVFSSSLDDYTFATTTGVDSARA